jgi:methyltransferase (TIGR00027 family)
MDPVIRDVSDTALWAAMFRAQESERPDALFHDPFAARLAGERGAEILAKVPHASDHAWAWVMRTYLFDRVIRSRVEAGVRAVVNLAAGLDSRPYRMELPPELNWVEVDLPELVAYKERVLAGEQPRCRFERVAMDLANVPARRDLFHRVGGGLAVCEGILIYLSEEQVAELARDLAGAGFDYWLFDLASPGLLQMLQATTGRSTAEAGAPLRFAPEERTAFFEPFGWQAVEIHSVFEAGVATGRFPKEMLTATALPPGVESEIWSGACLFKRTAGRGG